jgi:hypothetical protein
MATTSLPNFPPPNAEHPQLYNKISNLDTGAWDTHIYAYVILANDYERVVNEDNYWVEAVGKDHLCEDIVHSCLYDYEDYLRRRRAASGTSEEGNSFDWTEWTSLVMDELPRALKHRWTLLLAPEGLNRINGMNRLYGYEKLPAAFVNHTTKAVAELDDALLDERENFLCGYILPGTADRFIEAAFFRGRDFGDDGGPNAYYRHGIPFFDVDEDGQMYMEDLGKGMLFVSDIIFKMITINEE